MERGGDVVPRQVEKVLWKELRKKGVKE